MRSLRRPLFAARATLDLCIESIRDAQLTERLQKIVQQVETAEAAYRRHGEQQMFFAIPQTVGIGDVTVDEMKRVYKGTFAKSTRTRDIYDQIKKLPPNDICPLCGQRTVGTLDHYLAQAHHSALVVTPINLIPSCTDCNKAKLDAQPNDAIEQTFHPYFDDVDGERWLYATVEETFPAALIFRPDPPATWPEIKRARLLKHFRIFGLAALYASHSGAELNNIRYGLQRIAERGTPEHLRQDLMRRAES